MDIACTEEQWPLNSQPKQLYCGHCGEQIGLTSCYNPSRNGWKGRWQKSQLMMHSIGFISAKAATLLLVGSSRGWKNSMMKKKGSKSGIGSFVRNSSLISLYSLHVYIHFCLWSRNHDSLSSSDFVTLSRYADKKYFSPTAVAVW